MTSKTDHDLIADIQAGKREALGILFDRFSPALYDFIYRLVGDRDQTARLLEEVFTRIPSVIGELDAQTPVRGWLYGLAREFALTFLRQRDWLDALPPSDEPMVSGLVGDIWRAARSMPAFHRAVLAVEELHGLSPTEKARALGVMRTDLARLLEEARRSFDNQFDLQARQHGRPLSGQIDPERIWGIRRRIGTSGSLFGYLPAIVLPDSLADMIRAKVLRSANLGAAPMTAPPPAPTMAPPTPPPPQPSPVPPVVRRTPPPVAAETEGCAWRLVGIALLVALIVTALVVGIVYMATRDANAPVISRIEPVENAVIPSTAIPGSLTTRVNISATFRDDRAINPRSVRLVLDGRDVTAHANVTEGSVTYSADLDAGTHVVLVEVRDTSDNQASRAWQFVVGAPPEPTSTATTTPTITLTPTITRVPTATGTATPVPTPIINDFSATRTVITRGAPTLLTWNVSNADQVFLNQDRVDPVGNKLVSPTTTTTYYLIATTPFGTTAQKTLTITVLDLPDLTVPDITLTPNNQIMFTVRNEGPGDVNRPFLIQVTVNNLVVQSDRPVSALPAGQEAKLVVPNRTVVGDQTINVRVNLLQEVQETNYANNELTRTLSGPTATPTFTPTPTFTLTPTNTPTFTPTSTPTFTPTPTRTPTPTNPPTPTNTPTATPIPFAVTSISVSVTPPTYTGACPGNFTFTGSITANGAGVVTYQWERKDSPPLASATLTFSGAGTQTVTNQWLSAPAGDGWTRLHVTAPNDLTSTQATFTNSCH